MAKIKVQVSDKIKGEIHIPIIDEPILPGSYLEIDSEIVKSGQLRGAFEKNILRIINTEEDVKMTGKVKIKNKMNRPVTISCGRPNTDFHIDSQKTYFLDVDLLETPGIKNAINKGYLEVVEDTPPTKKNLKREDREPKSKIGNIRLSDDSLESGFTKTTSQNYKDKIVVDNKNGMRSWNLQTKEMYDQEESAKKIAEQVNQKVLENQPLSKSGDKNQEVQVGEINFTNQNVEVDLDEVLESEQKTASPKWMVLHSKDKTEEAEELEQVATKSKKKRKIAKKIVVTEENVDKLLDEDAVIEEPAKNVGKRKGRKLTSDKKDDKQTPRSIKPVGTVRKEINANEIDINEISLPNERSLVNLD